MPYISLTATEGNFHSHYGKNGNVEKQVYTHSHLFVRYEHTPTNDLNPETIYIYEKYRYGSGLDNMLTLQEGNSTYKNTPVKKAHVYYNAYDAASKYPLLFVIFFKGGAELHKYHKRSKFQVQMTTMHSTLVAYLTRYYTEEKILTDLISENDNISEPLTYDIGKTTSFSGGEEYNGKKIKVVDDSSSISKLGQNGFKKYKHTPQHNHKSKKSCVKYKDNVLFCWKDAEGEPEKIVQVQGQILETLIVYFSNRNKDQPLLAGFQIKLIIEWDHYYYKKCQKGFYWKKIDREESYYLLGKYTNETDIYNDLIQNEQNLIETLRKIEFSVFNSVVILVHKTGPYYKTNANEALGNAQPKIIPSPGISEAQPNSISVEKQIDGRLNEKDYYCYLHKILPVGTQDKAELRLLIPNSAIHNKFSEIELYENETTNVQNREYLYYDKSIENSSMLYFYFYGSDPRPLLFCHGIKTYSPKNKDNYFTKWVAISGLKSRACQTISSDDSLLDELTKVVGALNQVRLSEHPPNSNTSNSQEYNAHQYEGKYVKIKVDYGEINGNSSPTFKSCFRKLQHSSKGIDPYTNDHGFRLGYVSYNGEQNNSILYSKKSSYKHHPLTKVSAYFYDRDGQYRDPLLVELKFKIHPVGTKNEYYKLRVRQEFNLTWDLDDEASGKVASGANELALYLEKLRYGLKKVAQIRIQNQTTNYELKGGESIQPLSKYSKLKNKLLQVTKCLECKILNDANYDCFIHKLTDSDLDQIHSEIGGLKISISQEIPNKPSISTDSGQDQEITLYDIGPGKESKVKGMLKEGSNKDNDQDSLYSKIETMVTEVKTIYYSSCKGDVSVYFKKGDPRPLLMCFNGVAYRPLKLPKLDKEKYSYASDDYKKWVRAHEIKKCGCEDQDSLISVLKEVEGIYDGDNTLATALGSTFGTLAVAGGGTGLAIYKYSDFFLSLVGKVLSKGAA